MRLDRIIAGTGLTRSEAKKAIAAGRVLVDGVLCRDAGFDTVPGSVILDGARIPEARMLHLMVYKPAGVLTATEDRRLPTVLDLIPAELRRKGLGPAGRLDRDVTGLVLLTEDGQLAHRLISPRRGVEKVYEATVEGDPSDTELDRIREGGIVFTDFTSRPAGAERIGTGMIRLTLTEGRFHEVKRICAAIGHPVLRLKRISLGGVRLDPLLEEGQFRDLTEEEELLLYRVSGMAAQGDK